MAFKGREKPKETLPAQGGIRTTGFQVGKQLSALCLAGSGLLFYSII